MTATTKPPVRERRPRPRQLRFSSMETLGFSNPSATWTDSPVQVEVAAVPPRRGRHEAPEPEPETLADWDPGDFGARLTGRNVRWSIVVISLLVLCGAGALGYWLYQRPAAEAQASLETLSAEAERLQAALPTLETFAAALTAGEGAEPSQLFPVDEAARALFAASGDLSTEGSGLRSSAAAASTAALDGLRLAGDASSYRLAVAPILVPPELETDPNLIELDEAARDFGVWQLHYDEVRTALPEQAMAATTQRLDILSGDLPNILTRYMDALREDDQSAAVAALEELAGSLREVQDLMDASLAQIQARVADRIAEAESALSTVLDG